MKGSPSRKEQRKAGTIALTKGYGSQDKDFFKKVQKKRKIKKINKKYNKKNRA